MQNAIQKLMLQETLIYFRSIVFIKKNVKNMETKAR
jgi:hypothetical protein